MVSEPSEELLELLEVVQDEDEELWLEFWLEDELWDWLSEFEDLCFEGVIVTLWVAAAEFVIEIVVILLVFRVFTVVAKNFFL